MNKTLFKKLVLTAAVAVSCNVAALPVLQLDILGGTYDVPDETTVTSSTSFTLRALFSDKQGQTALAPSGKFYVAAALTPKTGPAHASLGSSRST